MNSSFYAVGKMHVAFACIALCAMILAPLAYVKAQAVAQGTLTVQKVISGTSTVPFTDFAFLVNGGSQTGFEADGSNQVTLNVGTYDITEVAVAGYTTTYAGCEDIVLTATNSPVCTITNTATTSGNGSLDPGVLVINKVIMGTTSASADDFTFDVVRNLITPVETNEPFETDGSNRYEVETGMYTVTEDVASGFTPAYSNSLNGDDDCENLLVTPNATTTCTITNTASSTNGTPTTTPAMGTLVINKEVNGGNAATSSFSFRVNGGTPVVFEADGTNRLSLATGTYAITEVPAANYTPTYSNCMSAVVTANATTTCTITNNFNVGGAQLYEITGIVWDDEDEDGVLDGDESRLENWSVKAEQIGEITRTDTTDANGRYTLLVTDGEWLVSETVQADWDQTYPSGGTHTVNATGTASTTIPLGDYNFGNDRDTSNGGGGGGGNGVRIELRDNDNDDDEDEDEDDDSSSGGGRTDDDEDEDDTSGAPGGVVLGESTSVYPYGAPDTGMGGGELQKLDGKMTLPLLSMIVVSLLGFGVVWAVRREEEIV